MSTYRVSVDTSLCSGFGSCVDVAPDLFRIETGGLAAVLVAETDNPAALDAADSCPMGAILVVEAVAA
jgi:ferredoxin